MEQKLSEATVGTSHFLQEHSVMLRIWHWLTFLLISASILTVLLASTILEPRNNAPLVQKQLKEKGLDISNEQAWPVAHAFEDKIWDVHKIIGIIIAFLLLSRIIIEFAQPREERIRSRLKNALQLFRTTGAGRADYRHYLIVKWTYLAFYLLLIFMATTGLSLAFGKNLGIPREIHRTIKDIHGAGQWVMYTFVLFHVGGVILADLGKAKGLVSGMIHGNK